MPHSKINTSTLDTERLVRCGCSDQRDVVAQALTRIHGSFPIGLISNWARF